jgi:hypothetical protein
MAFFLLRLFCNFENELSVIISFNTMKNIVLKILILAMSLLNLPVYSQTENPAATQDTSLLGLPGDNLDLYAVLDLFQKSKTIEDFEKSLNLETTKINNLDLNLDNKADFIKVTTKQKDQDFTFILQVDVTEKEVQDVAVILVSKDKNGKITLQMVGDPDLYGKDFVVEPKTEATPSVTANPAYTGSNPVTVNVPASTTTVVVESAPIVQYVYSPAYVPYYPPYYYSYYPPYFAAFTVMAVGIYRHNNYYYHGGGYGYHGGYGHGNTVVVHNNNTYNNYNNNSRNSSNTVNHNKTNGNYNRNNSGASASTRESGSGSNRGGSAGASASTRDAGGGSSRGSTGAGSSGGAMPSTMDRSSSGSSSRSSSSASASNYSSSNRSSSSGSRSNYSSSSSRSSGYSGSSRSSYSGGSRGGGGGGGRRR